jgi:hypothetical protein
VKRLEKMLPDEDGEFKSLKAELEVLDEVGGGRTGRGPAGTYSTDSGTCPPEVWALRRTQSRRPPPLLRPRFIIYPPKTSKAPAVRLQEADRFCDLYEREAKATTAALEGFRKALGASLGPLHTRGNNRNIHKPRHETNACRRGTPGAGGELFPWAPRTRILER